MKKVLPALVLFLASTSTLIHAAEDAPVSRAEFNQLQNQLQQNMKELAESKVQISRMKQEIKQLSETQAKAELLNGPRPEESETGELANSRDLPQGTCAPVSSGNSLLTLTGGASASFGSNGADNSFSAAFNPIFLWKLSDRVMAEGDVQFSMSEDSTQTQLQTARVSYLLTPWMTIAAGRFANPSNYFADHLRKDWVNRLPDTPLVVNGSWGWAPDYLVKRFREVQVLGDDWWGWMPEYETGAEIGGVIPIAFASLNYSLFIGNEPKVRTLPSNASQPGWYPAHFTEESHSKLGGGGRIGFEPIPGLEIGYGVQQFKASLEWDEQANWWYGMANHYEVATDPLIQSADFNFVKDSPRLGTLNLHAQWVWTKIGGSIPEGSLLNDPLWAPFASVASKSNGGYAQLSYRPTQLNCFVRNFEPVVRFDALGGGYGFRGDLQRWTFGLDYWLANSTMIKVAYEFDSNRGDFSKDVYLLQFATGF